MRGKLKTASKLLGEASETDTVPAPGEAWAAPRLLARLGVKGANQELREASQAFAGRPLSGFIGKPFMPEDLLTAVSGLIADTRAAGESLGA